MALSENILEKEVEKGLFWRASPWILTFAYEPPETALASTFCQVGPPNWSRRREKWPNRWTWTSLTLNLCLLQLELNDRPRSDWLTTAEKRDGGIVYEEVRPLFMGLDGRTLSPEDGFFSRGSLQTFSAAASLFQSSSRRSLPSADINDRGQSTLRTKNTQYLTALDIYSASLMYLSYI